MIQEQRRLEPGERARLCLHSGEGEALTTPWLPKAVEHSCVNRTDPCPIHAQNHVVPWGICRAQHHLGKGNVDQNHDLQQTPPQCWLGRTRPGQFCAVTRFLSGWSDGVQTCDYKRDFIKGSETVASQSPGWKQQGRISGKV